MKEITGLSASPGIAIAEWAVYSPAHIKIEEHPIADAAAEITRLDEALAQAKEQLEALAERAKEIAGEEEAEIFEAHQMFLEDPDLIGSVKETITGKKINAEVAFDTAVNEYASAFEQLDNEYFRARAADVRDVGLRVLRCLVGVAPEDEGFPAKPVIVVATDLTPSDTVQFQQENVLAIVTVRGGPTSHTAILARTIGIPAVVSVPLEFEELVDNRQIIVDGNAGQVILNPTKEALMHAQQSLSLWLKQKEAEEANTHAPAVTTDGQQVEIVANVGGAADAEMALQFGAEGIGLFRTEFLFLDRTSMPTEVEQIETYRTVADIMGVERPIVVRTLDIGGDKEVDYLGLKAEPNPFLGWRAIRMIDEHRRGFVHPIPGAFTRDG